MGDFVHLNVHTHYTMLQALCHMDKLVERCKELGMPAVAVTDKGNLFGCTELVKVCRKKGGVKPIVGLEAYVCADRHERGARERGHRVVFLARDYAGYQTLCRLATIGYMEGFYYRPRIDRAALEAHHEGLLVLSGGVGSELHEALVLGNEEEARGIMRWYRDLVGAENYFVEVQRTGIQELQDVEPALLALAAAEGVPLLATNDVHYIHAGDSEAHDVLCCVKDGKTLKDARRTFSTREFYLKTPQQMAELFADRPDLVANTALAAGRCNLEFPKKKYHIPDFVPPDGLRIEEHFDRLCREGLRRRYGDPPPPAILARYEVEKGVILRAGFPSYFLIVADFIGEARRRGIPVGPGRGSAAGSIVAYALEITDIDPLRYELLFERFLNEERVSMPDIDIDFCQDRRQEVIEYVVGRYGRDNVSMIITFGTMGAKAAVRDVGRVLSVPLADVNRLSKMIPDPRETKRLLRLDAEKVKDDDVTLRMAVDASQDLKKAVAESADIARLFELAAALEGTVRNASTHAAGVVISDRPLVEYVPLFKGDDTVSTQFPMTELEDLGLLKMDFLGLQNLTVIQKAVEMIAETRGERIDPRRLDPEDDETFAMLARGETVGVFQFESEGMREWLKKLKPTSIDDLIAMNALYRPGPMDLIPNYIRCKHGEDKVTYPHPVLEPILKATYGIPVYQEQVMQMAQAMGGYTLGGADLLRRAMGKKDHKEMDRQRGAFVEGAVRKGVEKAKAEEVFAMMAKFAGYGFNKSHAAAYSVVAFQTAYLKARYTPEFMAALMTCDVRNKDRIVEFREECRRLGVEVLSPHVNESNYDFRVVAGRIRYGLGGAKGVGKPAVEAIVEAREKGGPFRSFEEFAERVDLARCGKLAIEAMVKCGALDGLAGSRRHMCENLAAAMEMAQGQRRKAEQGQLMLFTVEAPSEAAGEALPEWPEREKLAHEKEVLGFYVSSHPLVAVEDTLRFFSTHATTQLKELEEGEDVCLGGLVTRHASRPFKEDRRIHNFHLEDQAGAVECVHFGDDKDRYGALLGEDAIVFVLGRVSRRQEGGAPGLKVHMVVPLEEAERSLAGSVVLHLDRATADEPFLRRLSGLVLEKAPRGGVPVFLSFRHESGDTVQMKLSERYNVLPDRNFLEAAADMLGKDRVEIRRQRKKVLAGGR